MFRIATASEVRSRFHWLDEDLRLRVPAPALGFELRGVADDAWESAVVLFQPGPGPVAIELPEGAWWVFVQGERARASRPLEEEPVRGSMTVPGRSVVVLARPRGR